MAIQDGDAATSVAVCAGMTSTGMGLLVVTDRRRLGKF
jgi:hypothetical protein